MTTQGRKCGTCTACCTVIPIPELSKRANVTCKFVQANQCSIYPNRPKCCRGFFCEWIDGELPEGARPDISGVVIQLNVIADTMVMGAHMWEVHPHALNGRIARRARKKFLAKKLPVVLYPLVGAISVLVPKGTRPLVFDFDQEGRKIETRYV